jgi:hypothetical protein
MYRLKKLITAAILIVMAGFPFHGNSQTAPYHLTKINSGYKVEGLPTELLKDLSKVGKKELVVLSLVDPSYGRSKIQGYVRAIDKTTLSIRTKDSFIFHPDLNRTYMLFELDSAPAAGGSCSGCTLTNTNLKATSPQICWCFSKLTLGQNNESCSHSFTQLRFPTPEESAFKLRKNIGEPKRFQAIYLECYPSSGEGGEDCSLFDTLCAGGGGGSSSLPGGGSGCSVE